MKKQILILTILALTVGLTMNSCKKKGCTDEIATNFDSDAEKDDESCEYGDTTRPVITIAEPSMDMYHLMNGEATIPIKVNISDNEGLHSVKVVLMNTTDGTEELHVHLHPDETIANVDTSFTGTDAHKDYELTVTAEDHEQNQRVETATTHIHMM